MVKILILAAANISTCPRPMRMLELLKDEIMDKTHEVSVMGIDSESGAKMPPVRLRASESRSDTPKHASLESSLDSEITLPSFSYPAYKRRSRLQELRLWLDVALSRWDRLAFTHNRLHIIDHLRAHRYDVIICHDLLLLPALFRGLGENPHRTKVIFDAREFYPLQNTSSLRWRLLFKRFNAHLCRTYAQKADIMLSVSPHFCHLYKQHFGLNARTFMSLPPYFALTPSKTNPAKVKILYHGALNQNRGIDEVVELITRLEGRFSIDFIFTGGERAFRAKIESKIAALIAQGYALRLLEPVRLEEIIPFGHAYDLGLLYVPAHNANLRATLPNKLFEYTQSRLGLIMPPLESATALISRYRNAAVAEDFSMEALARVINALGTEDIEQLKNASRKAASELHLGQNKQILRECLAQVLRPMS